MEISDLKSELDGIDPLATWRLSRTVASRECKVHQVLSDRGHQLAIKQYHPHVNLKAPKTQYKAIALKQETLTASEMFFRVPKVYAFDTGKKRLVMDWAQGQSLMHKMWFNSPNPPRQHAVYHAGQWLRRFHEASAPKVKKADPFAYLHVVENQKATAPLPTHPLFDRACHQLKTLIAQREGEAPLQAVPHGDFTPYNLLLEEKSVTGIDMWGVKPAPVVNDLARMTVYLTIAYPLYFRGRFYNRQGQLAAPIRPLYEGYGEDIFTGDELELRVALLSEYLRRWRVIRNRRPYKLRKLTDRFQIARIQQQVQSILSNH